MSVDSLGSVNGWIAIVLLAVGTFIIRFSFIGLLAGKTLPPRFARMMQLAVPAIFAGLVLPLIVIGSHGFALDERWPHVIAAIVTGLVAAWRGGMFLPVVAGMAVLHGILALVA
ncbi:MAG: AzlD domain-containing protein [Proteobacteria bacterium]|nr:AzlD domain-containing protein [Pseudomonadota bacterium]